MESATAGECVRSGVSRPRRFRFRTVTGRTTRADPHDRYVSHGGRGRDWVCRLQVTSQLSTAFWAENTAALSKLKVLWKKLVQGAWWYWPS